LVLFREIITGDLEIATTEKENRSLCFNSEGTVLLFIVFRTLLPSPKYCISLAKEKII